MTLYNEQGQPLSATDLRAILQGFSSGDENIPRVFTSPGDPDSMISGARGGAQIRDAVNQSLMEAGFDEGGGSARGPKGEYYLPLDDPNMLAHAQSLGALTSIAGVPVANYNDPNLRGGIGSGALFTDMPQENTLATIAPALLGAAGGIAGGLAGLGGVAEAGVGAGSLTGGAAADTLGSGLWGGAIDSANAAGLGTAAGSTVPALDYSMTGTLGGGTGTAVAGAGADAAALGGGAVNAAATVPTSLASGVGGGLGGAETLGAAGAAAGLGGSIANGISNAAGTGAPATAGTGAMTGATTAAGGATAASALSKLISGQDMTAADWAALGIGAAGAVVPAVGSYLAGDKTAETIKGIYDTQRADRAPALAAYNNALANPDTFYNSAPATGALNGVLAKLSAQGGNPANNPGALSQAAAYNLGGYSNYLSGLAGPAFGGQATQAQLGSNLANAQGSQYAGVGYGLGTLLGNQSQPQYGLTIGGMRF